MTRSSSSTTGTRASPAFQMVGIVRDDDTKSAFADYVDARGLDWTVRARPREQAALDFATRGQPETYVISPDGGDRGLEVRPRRRSPTSRRCSPPRRRARDVRSWPWVALGAVVVVVLAIVLVAERRASPRGRARRFARLGAALPRLPGSSVAAAARPPSPASAPTSGDGRGG